MEEAKKRSIVERKNTVLVKRIKGFKKDIQKHLEGEIKKFVKNINNKDNELDSYIMSYNYVINQLMGMTLERHATMKKVIPPQLGVI